MNNNFCFNKITKLNIPENLSALEAYLMVLDLFQVVYRKWDWNADPLITLMNNTLRYARWNGLHPDNIFECYRTNKQQEYDKITRFFTSCFSKLEKEEVWKLRNLLREKLSKDEQKIIDILVEPSLMIYNLPFEEIPFKLDQNVFNSGFFLKKEWPHFLTRSRTREMLGISNADLLLKELPDEKTEAWYLSRLKDSYHLLVTNDSAISGFSRIGNEYNFIDRNNEAISYNLCCDSHGNAFTGGVYVHSLNKIFLIEDRIKHRIELYSRLVKMNYKQKNNVLYNDRIDGFLRIESEFKEELLAKFQKYVLLHEVGHYLVYNHLLKSDNSCGIPSMEPSEIEKLLVFSKESELFNELIADWYAYENLKIDLGKEITNRIIQSYWKMTFAKNIRHLWLYAYRKISDFEYVQKIVKKHLKDMKVDDDVFDLEKRLLQVFNNSV